MALSGEPVALVTHARAVRAAERAAFAARIRAAGGGAILLETCHRVEAYRVVRTADADGTAGLPAGGFLLRGEAAARHAIAVAVGRDSVVIGEDQVLHQLRRSVETARLDGHLDPSLEHLFTLALRAGRRSRSWRTGPVPSLADVAVAEIERAAGPIAGREVLAVGAGTMGRLAVRAAKGRGATVSIANRSPERVQRSATTRGVAVGPLDPGPSAGRFAAVIVAISGPWTIGPETAAALTAGTTVVVDVSVPAAVPPALVESLGPRHLGADDLALVDPLTVAADDPTVARLDALVDSTTDEFRRWLEARGGRDAAATLAERAEAERQAELLALWRQLPDLDVGARAAIEQMSRHLAGRLLREPFERLGRDADGHHERAARDLFGL